MFVQLHAAFCDSELETRVVGRNEGIRRSKREVYDSVINKNLSRLSQPTAALSAFPFTGLIAPVTGMPKREKNVILSRHSEQTFKGPIICCTEKGEDKAQLHLIDDLLVRYCLFWYSSSHNSIRKSWERKLRITIASTSQHRIMSLAINLQ